MRARGAGRPRRVGTSHAVLHFAPEAPMLARVVGEWTGAARLRRLVTTLRAPASPGEVRISGRVETEVVVSARAETGAVVHAEAVATVVR